MIDSRIQSAYATHIGKVRDHNEDSLCHLPEKCLWMIADGMGGHQGGKIASAHVVEEVPKRINLGTPLRQAITETHHRIKELVRQNHGPKGMGSTVVALTMNGFNYEVCWVGDSRAYLWDSVSLVQVTRDHSYVQDLIDLGVIQEHEALEHPQRNIISRALGSDSYEEVQVDSITGQLHSGDKVLLCSDGLTTELSRQEITETLSLNKSCQATVDLLVQKANEKGGRDNITAILVEAPSGAPAKERTTTRPVVSLSEAPSPMKNDWIKRYRILVWLPILLVLLICLVFFAVDKNMQQNNGGKSVQDPVQDTIQIKKTYIPLNDEEIPKKKD